jgi:phenylpropionate dioxygenase-like ring-hydroxylating dioxygenase large terminal subunit
MVAFRGTDGRAGVLDAFCPHLGTHLGHGGTVDGNNLKCPYHSWEFDADGKCHSIPYCSKDMSKSTRINAKKYEIRELLNM